MVARRIWICNDLKGQKTAGGSSENMGPRGPGGSFWFSELADKKALENEAKE